MRLLKPAKACALIGVALFVTAACVFMLPVIVFFGTMALDSHQLVVRAWAGYMTVLSILTLLWLAKLYLNTLRSMYRWVIRPRERRTI